MATHAFAPRFDLSNVFLAPVADAAAPGEPSFALLASGPAVSADEVESHVDAVEVTVRWGSQVLKVAHLAQGASFFVGEGSGLALPGDVLGAERAPIVLARGPGAVVVAPAASRGTIALRDGSRETFAGPREISLAHGMTVTLEVGHERADGTTGEPITFEIGTVRAGKVLPVGFLAQLAGGATGFVGLSFLGHAAIVAALAMFMPKLGADDAEAIDRDQMMLMQRMLNASAERETEQLKEETAPSDSPAGGGSVGGEAHKGESGAAGTTRPVTTNGRMAIKGTEDHAELSPKQEAALAAEFGMIGLLGASRAADPNGPKSPWATVAVGNEDKSAEGALFGQTIDDAAGFGLGLSGVGEGGGGNGLGVGAGGIGTIGGGGGKGPWGFGPGDKGGMGIGHGPGQGGHPVHPIRLRPDGEAKISGHLPREVIQRIVRQNFGRFRMCYEQGLRNNPGLTGRISTAFVIGRDGSVSQSMDAGSDLPDQNVVACVVKSFQSLSFPSPEGGIATVTYPIVLTPGD
ncbi:MAG: putative abductin-like protein [Labilithrix sp.]|nr:putative abductin-like protein [Labilithrix sp.]